jgi:GNAT superfamily N-acetyltransferase
MVTLCDGTAAIIRPIHADDALRLQALFARLSPESIFFRFLGPRKELPNEQAEDLANVDYQTRMALVATYEQCGQEEIIAVARYARMSGTEDGLVEAAIVVEDRDQGQGLGTLLLKRLVSYARTYGIRTFLALVHSNNGWMMRFIQRSGLPTERKAEPGALEIRVKLEADADLSGVTHPGRVEGRHE